MVSTELRIWREQLGLTQRKLSEYLFVSKDAIASWETGRRPIPGMLALALKELARELADDHARR